MFTIGVVLSMTVCTVCLLYIILAYFKKKVRFKIFPKGSPALGVWFFVAGISMFVLLASLGCIHEDHDHTKDGSWKLLFGSLAIIPFYHVCSVLSSLHDKIKES